MEDLLATANYMSLTTIMIEETEGLERGDEPVTLGLPFPEGLIRDASKLVLHDEMGTAFPLQTQVLATWPDDSLKWVLLDFQASVPPKSTKEMDLILDRSGTVSDLRNHIVLDEDPNYLFVNTKKASFFVNTRVFRPLDRVVLGGQEVLYGRKSRMVLRDESGAEYEPLIDRIFFETEGALRTTLKAEGAFRSESGETFASFLSRVSFFAHSAAVRIEFAILNPKAAAHPGGLWDLGDPGSVFFRDLSLRVVLNTQTDTNLVWTTSPPGRNPHPSGRGLLIYQDSSGGENWDSSNHVNRDGDVPNAFRGYRVYSHGKVIKEGDRALPWVSLGDGDKRISAALRCFWQNFPKAIAADRDTITLSLYPEQYGDLFELQGGERKTHTLLLDFGDTRGTGQVAGPACQPLVARAEPEWYANSGAVEYLVPRSDSPDKAMEALLDTAVSGDASFFRRREIIDEYGWRHFGELYADHEAVGHKGPGPLVSHYNNQYDCVWGMLVQFARTGDSRWFVLADQLCAHVRDIDVYHTDEDRPEYNHGLLWHTEHYLDAGTATHRCFSKAHAPHRGMGAYGGGPSLSHIYSGGFLLHHYMTGEADSKDAALECAAFVMNNMDMSRTLSGRIIRGMRTSRLSLKRMVGKEELVEFQKVYELDGPGRASGNALSVLANAFALTSDERHLEKADILVRTCIHPEDDIEKRDFGDVENRWMYVVFLQALGRYLDIRTERGRFGPLWEYARRSLIHYAEWMAENEHPYLEKPEKLEYPNETWAAQDIRKCNVLLHASRYSREASARRRFMEKAFCFYEQAVSHLFRFDSRTLTRPLILAAVNAGMYAHAKAGGLSAPDFAELPDSPDWGKIRKTARDSFSLKRELQFLKWRI